jgi:hypothetical protein
VFISFAIVGALLVAALAFILGQTAANPTQRGLEEKLVLVRQKAATCTQERDRLRAKEKRTPDYRKSPVYKIQKENDELADKNNELAQDNDNLRDEKAMLEETLAELRFDLDSNSIINDKERTQLDDLQKTGNMSQTLKDFLNDQLAWGGVDKDELLPKLMDELKWKKTSFQACQKVIVRTREQLESAKKLKAQAKEQGKEQGKKEGSAVKQLEALLEEMAKQKLAALDKEQKQQDAADIDKSKDTKDATIDQLLAALEMKREKNKKEKAAAKAAGKEAGKSADKPAEEKPAEKVEEKSEKASGKELKLEEVQQQLAALKSLLSGAAAQGGK